MRQFAFELGTEVRINVSQEHGRIIGRAQYEKSENSYMIRYKAADGRAVEAWWPENALVLHA